MEMKIITNHQPRQLIYGYELSDSERAEFDYIGDIKDIDLHNFFRYRGEVYDPSEFMAVDHVMTLHNPEFSAWDGYQSNSYFSGIVIKYVDDCESVIVGLYLS